MDLFRDVRVEKDLEEACRLSEREGKWSSVGEVDARSGTFVDLEALRTLVKNNMAEEKRVKGKRVKLFRPKTGLFGYSDSAMGSGGRGGGFIGGGDDGGQRGEEEQLPVKPEWPQKDWPWGDGAPKRGGGTRRTIGTGVGMAILGAGGGQSAQSVPIPISQ